MARKLRIEFPGATYHPPLLYRGVASPRLVRRCLAALSALALFGAASCQSIPNDRVATPKGISADLALAAAVRQFLAAHQEGLSRYRIRIKDNPAGNFWEVVFTRDADGNRPAGRYVFNIDKRTETNSGFSRDWLADKPGISEEQALLAAAGRFAANHPEVLVCYDSSINDNKSLNEWFVGFDGFGKYSLPGANASITISKKSGATVVHLGE